LRIRKNNNVKKVKNIKGKEKKGNIRDKRAIKHSKEDLKSGPKYLRNLLFEVS
jgi:hypothetical protein